MPDHDALARTSGEHTTDDHALIARIRQGDVSAFEQLIVTHANTLTKLAYYITGSRDAADDVVQQVFVELWERRDTLDPHRLQAFLHRAIRNRALDETSAAARRERYGVTQRADANAGGIVAPVRNPEDALLAATTVHGAVHRLATRRRIAIQLRFQEQMTHAEIAEVLGISPLAAQLLVVRGLADLRGMLKKE